MGGRKLKKGLTCKRSFTLGCIIVCMSNWAGGRGWSDGNNHKRGERLSFQAVDGYRKTGIGKSATFETFLWLWKP